MTWFLVLYATQRAGCYLVDGQQNTGSAAEKKQRLWQNTNYRGEVVIRGVKSQSTPTQPSEGRYSGSEFENFGSENDLESTVESAGKAHAQTGLREVNRAVP